MTQRPPRPTLFPYTTLFRSSGTRTTTWARARLARCTARALASRARDCKGFPATPGPFRAWRRAKRGWPGVLDPARRPRSEEHTSELQSLAYLVCRLLLEKKK